MIRILLASMLPLALGSGALAESEAFYAGLFCYGMDRQVATSEGTIADCVSDTHAIEVDFTPKWAEAIGQSLHYAEQLQRRAGVILVCTNPGLCFAHTNRVRRIVEYNELNITIWMCATDNESLGECVRFNPDRTDTGTPPSS